MYIHAKVVAGAKSESFVIIKEAHYAISVREKAERNAANMRVRELVAGHFGVPAKSARIVSGHHSPSKLLSVPDPT